MRRSFPIAVFVTLAVLPLAAQTLTVGNDVGTPNAGDGSIADVRTDIDLANPANATGTLTSATYFWAANPCTSAAKIKIFRRVGDTFNLVAERGPFSNAAATATVTLTPAIQVMQGDLVAISRVSNCGNPTALVPGWQNNYLSIAGEPASFTLGQATLRNATLAVKASGTATEVVAGIIPAVASKPGIGAFFRTTLQLASHPPYGSTPMTGKLVFRRVGVPGSPADTTLPFSIMPGDMRSWDDIVAAVGLGGTSASVDVVVPWGKAMPVVAIQLFNDQGDAGTTGFRQEVVDLKRDTSQVITPGFTGYLLGPTDATRFRCNLGVRSLDGGVQGTVEVRNAAGTVLGTGTFRYPPNTYDQKSFKDFTGITLQDDVYVRVTVSTGSAIFYASIVDNATADPANILARAFEGVI